MSLEKLLEHRAIWETKPVLRDLYKQEFFERLIAACVEGGRNLEVGAGPGLLKQFAPATLSSDIVWCPWLDISLDAHHMPFGDHLFDNIIGLDVLHHLSAPIQFFQEVTRVLRVGGRLVVIEPWITPVSFVIYRYFHQEECELSVNPLRSSSLWRSKKKPFEGNQAIPYLLLERHYLDFQQQCRDLEVIQLERFCLFGYLLSMGFRRVSLLPQPLYVVISAFEKWSRPMWERLASLRALIVLEKQR
jgi:SAM-dependent methyltransferase